MGAVNCILGDYPAGQMEASIEELKQNLKHISSLYNCNDEIPPNIQSEILENLRTSFKAQRDFFNNYNKFPDVQELFYNGPYYP